MSPGSSNSQPRVVVEERIETTVAAVRAEIFSDVSHAEVTTCLKVFEKIAGEPGGAKTTMQVTHEIPMDR